VGDADEPVSGGSWDGVVGVSSGPTWVVEVSGAWRRGDSGERPLVDDVREPSVAEVSGEDGSLRPSCSGANLATDAVIARPCVMTSSK
jgi:hypothetical protein